MNFTSSRRAEFVVDITPLIDILFQLVLFFMVSTSFVTAPGIQVDLPRSSADTILRQSSEVRVWITKDGSVYVDDRPVDWEGLRSALVEAAAVDAESLVIMKADAGVDHGTVVAVMDLARSEGLSHLAVATEPNLQGAGAR